MRVCNQTRGTVLKKGRGTASTLTAGETTGFNVTVGTFELARPTAYELYAFAQRK